MRPQGIGDAFCAPSSHAGLWARWNRQAAQRQRARTASAPGGVPRDGACRSRAAPATDRRRPPHRVCRCTAGSAGALGRGAAGNTHPHPGAGAPPWTGEPRAARWAPARRAKASAGAARNPARAGVRAMCRLVEDREGQMAWRRSCAAPGCCLALRLQRAHAAGRRRPGLFLDAAAGRPQACKAELSRSAPAHLHLIHGPQGRSSPAHTPRAVSASCLCPLPSQVGSPTRPKVKLKR